MLGWEPLLNSVSHQLGQSRQEGLAWKSLKQKRFAAQEHPAELALLDPSALRSDAVYHITRGTVQKTGNENRTAKV